MASGAIGGVAAAVKPAAGEFPVGLRVLLVDDDMTCLKVMEKKLLACRYNVTTCSQATVALKLLREKKGEFDLVLSDVYMPDMDGFKLLELIGLEMDLPVIMISADDGKNVVMKGVIHGACDYLIKPVSIQALQNIWQHVVRKRRNEISVEQTGSFEENDKLKKALDDGDHASPQNEGCSKGSKRKKDEKEEEDENEEREDSSSTKKPRVLWSPDLHKQFVAAVNHLGVDKSVPKKILELMNIPGLTRENVASHLQKYRLYLRRLSGSQNHGRPDDVALTSDAAYSLGILEGFDMRALTIPGPLHQQHNHMNLQMGPPRVAANGRGIPAADPTNYMDPYKQVASSALLPAQTWDNNQTSSLSRASPFVENQSHQMLGNINLQMNQGASGFSNSLSSISNASSFHGGIIGGHQKHSVVAQMTQQPGLPISLPKQHNNIQTDARWQSQPSGRGVPNGLAVGQDGLVPRSASLLYSETSLAGGFAKASTSGVVPRSVLPSFESGFMNDPFGPLAHDINTSELTSMDTIHQPLNATVCGETLDGATGLKGGDLPKYDLLSELFQNRRPQSKFQYSNSVQSKADFGQSFLAGHDLFASSTAEGDNMNACTTSNGKFSVRTEVGENNVSRASSRNKIKNVTDGGLQEPGVSDNSCFNEVINRALKQHEVGDKDDLEFNIDAYPLDDFTVSFATS